MSTNTALDQIKKRVKGHTEGPWFAHQEYIDMGVEDAMKTITNSPERYAGKLVASVGLDWEVKAGNAELIAAAPKLLAALEAVDARLSAWQEHAIGMSAEDCTTRALAFMLRSAIEEALR